MKWEECSEMKEWTIKHNPEFTCNRIICSLCKIIHDMMDITEEFISKYAQKCCGTTKITYQGKEIDLDTKMEKNNNDRLQ